MSFYSSLSYIIGRRKASTSLHRDIMQLLQKTNVALEIQGFILLVNAQAFSLTDPYHFLLAPIDTDLTYQSSLLSNTNTLLLSSFKFRPLLLHTLRKHLITQILLPSHLHTGG